MLLHESRMSDHYILAARMAIITSPLAPEASFNQGATIEGAAGPSNGLYSSLVAAQRSNIDGPLAFQNLSNVESSRSESLVKQGLSSGHSAGDLARATSNHNHSLGKQRSLRPRAENQNLAHRPRAQLSRTKTDFVHDLPPTRSPEADELEQIRHGWEDQYSSSEYLSVLSSVRVFQWPPYPLALLTITVTVVLHVLH